MTFKRLDKVVITLNEETHKGTVIAGPFGGTDIYGQTFSGTYLVTLSETDARLGNSELPTVAINEKFLTLDKP